MHVFQLILFSIGVPHEAEMKALLEAYLSTQPSVPYVFYCFDPSLSTDQSPKYDPDSRLLSFAGNEEYTTGILRKTLLALRWVLQHFPRTDYIVRSNISTFIHWPKLNALLRAHAWTYTGPYYHRQSRVDEQAGFTEEKARLFGCVPFVSGTCIVLSKQVAAFLACMENVLIGEIAVVDDLAIGILMNSPKYAKLRECFQLATQRHDIPMDRRNRTMSINHTDTDIPEVVAYRNKRDASNRAEDVRAMGILVERLSGS